ncbi:urease accessory protein UreD [Oscillatoria sp. FACHB-1406]|uniref:urease accessory protein UreD n=1 Tax=Oscillatoria sp. FACHB-1406 TaxID=2692846 RepID=UPI00168890C2|nr:urease accessory protein UreD [Oscillatoria sp. FACHB-1406]MBD2577087.1 urease accessory protein UreD [Oscillatoria sp. FACHB-1406]
MSDELSGWQGCLDLVYRHCDDATRIARAYARAPLKVQRPFYPEGPQVCHTVMLHTAGGIVGGDRLSATIHLLPHSRALITAPAATKVYRSNGQLARYTTAFNLEPEASLEWLPPETILFEGADYQQQTRVELAPGASFLGWEIARFGRSARNERFLHGEWRSRFEIWQQGKPLWIDRQRLQGSEENCTSANALAGYPLVGSLIYIGKPVSEELLARVRNLIDSGIIQKKSQAGQFGATRTQAGGLLCRYRGDSTAEVRKWFIEVWRLLRLANAQSSPILPRVWQ